MHLIIDNLFDEIVACVVIQIQIDNFVRDSFSSTQN